MSRLAVVAVVAGSLMLPGGLLAAELGVGDKAPALTIKSWVKGEAFDLADAGKDDVVVVEFWATWCPPCRTSIPHLSELSDHFKSKKVTFIGISDEDEKTVQKFMKDGWDAKMRYRVAIDKDKKTGKDWMQAAGKSGIPTAFVVKGGKIAWIGHPMAELDLKVAELCGDEVYAKQARELAEAKKQLSTAIKEKEWKDALAATERILKAKPQEHQVSILRYRILALELKETEKAAKAGLEFVNSCDAAEPLNAFSWEMMTEDDFADARDMKLAKLAAEKALKLSDEKDAAIIDTYARALAETGDLAGAIEWQEKAIKACDPKNAQLKSELEKAMKEYKKKAAEGA